MIAVLIQAPLNLTTGTTIGNPTLPGTEMPVIAVIIHLPTVRDAPGIIIVKDPRDTTPQTVMQNAHLGDHIQDLHF